MKGLNGYEGFHLWKVSETGSAFYFSMEWAGPNIQESCCTLLDLHSFGASGLVGSVNGFKGSGPYPGCA